MPQQIAPDFLIQIFRMVGPTIDFVVMLVAMGYLVGLGVRFAKR